MCDGWVCCTVSSPFDAAAPASGIGCECSVGDEGCVTASLVIMCTCVCFTYYTHMCVYTELVAESIVVCTHKLFVGLGQSQWHCAHI